MPAVHDSPCSPGMCSACSASSRCCCYGSKGFRTGRSALPTPSWGSASGLPARLPRALGGAVMQSILGALLTAGYAAAFGATIANAPIADKRLITNSVVHQLLKSFAGAVDTAHRYPQYASQITAAAKSAFLSGDHAAYAAGIVAILLGAALVFFLFPNKESEERLLAEYHSQDTRHTGTAK